MGAVAWNLVCAKDAIVVLMRFSTAAVVFKSRARIPITLLLSLTGVTLAWPDLSRDVARTVVSVSGRLDVDLPNRRSGTPAIDADHAIEAVSAGARVHSLRLLTAKHAYSTRHSSMAALSRRIRSVNSSVVRYLCLRTPLASVVWMMRFSSCAIRCTRPPNC